MAKTSSLNLGIVIAGHYASPSLLLKLNEEGFISSDTCIVLADSAIDHLLIYQKDLPALRYISIGDFDSGKIQPEIEHIILPKNKDVTDTEAAFDYLKSLEISQILLLFGLEKKNDSLAHLLCLMSLIASKKRGTTDVVGLSEENIVIPISNDALTLSLPLNTLFSIFDFDRGQWEIRGSTFDLDQVTLRNPGHGLHNRSLGRPIYISYNGTSGLIVVESIDVNLIRAIKKGLNRPL